MMVDRDKPQSCVHNDIIPWEFFCVYLIGPWEINDILDEKHLSLFQLMMAEVALVK